MFNYDPTTDTDSYKASHHLTEPTGVTYRESYMTARGGRWPEIVWAGHQGYLKSHFEGPLVHSTKQIDEAVEFWADHFGRADVFKRESWDRVLEVHEGKMPLEIWAAPEGMVIPTGHVTLKVVNTDPNLSDLTNWIETMAMHLWYPSTIATNTWMIKKNILGFLEKTGTPEEIDFKLHDFGFRGASCFEQAAIGGFAHQLSFRGSDNTAGIRYAREYYGERMPANSIPATEHASIIIWGGDEEAETAAFKNMLDKFPEGTIACVSDTYDIQRACSRIWGETLKDQVLSRSGTLVVRPDSGDPLATVMDVLYRLGEAFGYKLNEKGYKVLPPQVRIIQGDGIDAHRINQILTAMMQAGWSADNIAFGSGGGLLVVSFDRDTGKWGIKASWAMVDGEERMMSKKPMSDLSKASLPGRLQLINRDGKFHTVQQHTVAEEEWLLNKVYRNGEVLNVETQSTIKERLAQY